jgi:hypothetical protein
MVRASVREGLDVVHLIQEGDRVAWLRGKGFGVSSLKGGVVIIDDWVGLRVLCEREHQRR